MGRAVGGRANTNDRRAQHALDQTELDELADELAELEAAASESKPASSCQSAPAARPTSFAPSACAQAASVDDLPAPKMDWDGF